MPVVNDILEMCDKLKYDKEKKALLSKLVENGITNVDIELEKDGTDWIAKLSDGEESEVMIFGVDEDGAYVLSLDGETDDPLGEESDIIDFSTMDPKIAEDGSLDLTDLKWMNKSAIEALFCEAVEETNEAAMKWVVRGGKKVKIPIKIKKKRLSPKQKAALAKARKVSARSASAKRKRKFSAGIRKRSGI